MADIPTHPIPDDGHPVLRFGTTRHEMWNRAPDGTFRDPSPYYVVHRSLDPRRPTLAVKGYASFGARHADVLEEFYLPE